MPSINLGNIVGLLKSETPPTKKYVIWAKILNPSFPDIVELYYWDDIAGAWTLLTDSTTNYWLKPVITQSVTVPPPTPLEGDRYLIPTGASGVWSTHVDQVAHYKSGAWQYTTPLDGYIMSIRDEANKLYDYRGLYGFGGAWFVNDFQVPIAPGTYIPSTEKAAALGVATLDVGTKVPAAQINGATLPFTPASPGDWSGGMALVGTALDELRTLIASGTSDTDDWKRGGNTVGSISSMGTLDDYDVVFKRNNIESFRMLTGGNVGVGGLTTVDSKLQVKGELNSKAFKVVNSTDVLLFEVGQTGGSDYANLSADTVTIGRVGGIVNIIGTTNYNQVTNLQVSDTLITVNKGGGVSSATDTGWEIEEGGSITGYFKTTSDRNGYRFKAPNVASFVTFDLSTVSANRIYTLPNNSGTVALLSDISGAISGAWSLLNGGTLTGHNTIVQNGFNVTFTGTGKVTFSPSATLTGFNWGSIASDPSGLSNGDAWYDTTNTAFRGRQNEVSNYFITIAGGTQVNRVPYGTTIPGVYTNSTNFVFDGTGMYIGGGSPSASIRLQVNAIAGTFNPIALFHNSGGTERFRFREDGFFAISSVVNNTFVVAQTYTNNASGQYSGLWSGTVTFRGATSNDILYGTRYTQNFTVGGTVTTPDITGVNLAYTYTLNNTGADIIGLHYSPTFAGSQQPATHLAIRTDLGNIFFANASGDTATSTYRVDVRGIASNGAMRVADSTNTKLLMDIPDGGALVDWQSLGLRIRTNGAGAGGISLNGSTVVSNSMIYTATFSFSNANQNWSTGNHTTFTNGSGGATNSSGTTGFMQFFGTFAGSSTGAFNHTTINGTINALANGQVNILNIAPTYTAAGGNVYGINYDPTVTSVTGAHIAFRSTSGQMFLQHSNLGAVHSDSKGIALINPTAATNVLDQWSPGIILGGFGWSSIAVASHEAKYRIFNKTTFGSTTTQADLTFGLSKNGGAYSDILILANNQFGNTTLTVGAGGAGGIVAQGLTGLASLLINKTNGANSTTALTVQSIYDSVSGTSIVNLGGFGPASSGSSTYSGYIHTGTINQSGTATGAIVLMNIAPVITSVIADKLIGHDWNPSGAGISTVHLAYRSTAGNIFFANASGDTPTANTRLDVRGATVNIARFASSSNTAALTVLATGASMIGGDSQAPTLYATSDGLTINNASGKGLLITSASTTYTSAFQFNIVNTFNATSGNQGGLKITTAFSPTSGTAAYFGTRNNTTVNQTGGANGQITIFGGDPIITAAVNVTGYDWNPTTPNNISGTHLAFRAVTGNVLIGASTITAGSVALEIGSTTRALLLSRSGADIASPVDGMLHYLTGTGLRLRDAGAWVTLGSGGSGWVVDGLTTFTTTTTVDLDGQDLYFDDTAGTALFQVVVGGNLHLESSGGGGTVTLLGDSAPVNVTANNSLLTLSGADITMVYETGGQHVFSFLNNHLNIDGDGGDIYWSKPNTSATISHSISGAQGIAGATTGNDVYLSAGNGYATGTTNGGSLFLSAGMGNAGGTQGNIIYDGASHSFAIGGANGAIIDSSEMIFYGNYVLSGTAGISLYSSGGTIDSGNVTIATGDVTGASNDSGHVYINTGTSGSSLRGNIGFFNTSVTWQAMQQGIYIGNATAEPTGNPANGVFLWAFDQAASSELRVRDEAGNVTTLSPHNFSLIGKPSEDMAWSYYSEKRLGNKTKKINVDMLAVIREVEKIVGRQLVFENEI